MRKLQTVLLALAVGTVVAAVWSGGASAAGLRGVVVARSHGTLLVALPSGTVRAVHGSAAIGSRVVGARVVGRASHARLHGVVVERIGATAFLSSNRHLLAVRSTDPTPAAPGTVVDTTVTVGRNGELEEETEHQVGQVRGDLQVQATVTAVGPGSVTLSVDGQSVTVPLPSGLTLPAGIVGQTVTVTVSLGRSDDEGDEDDGDHHGGHGGDDG